MPEIAIKVENLSKRYRIGLKEQFPDTFVGAMTSWLKTPFYNFRQLRQLSHFSDKGSDTSDVIWALKDVSFGVKQGEVVGVIGRNGAGKSTVLKIISRITEPTTGRATINGRVSSLLEVGTGFHPDLTGRENIYLNGTVLGMSKQEVDHKFEEIVDFSGVEKFIDTPVKRYSSGMLVRLAFSVAAHLEPEILLVDEVLAVGDATFQKKCLGKMQTVSHEGRTILFVSHNMEAIRALCQRGLWFNEGRIQADGNAGDVVQAYLNSLSQRSFHHENGDYGLTIQKVALKNRSGEETLEFSPGEDLIVEIWYCAQKRVEKPYFAVVVQGRNGVCFSAHMQLDGCRPAVLQGTGLIVCRFKSIPLLPQSYTVKLAITAKDGNYPILSYQDVISFTVAGDLQKYGCKGEFRLRVLRSNSVIVPYEWVFSDGTVASIALSDPSK
jgi:lipopolysaccharide transport system ATP-binding protein